MSELKCEMHVYDINRCGLYMGRKHKHLDVKALFKELKYWAIDSGKPLIETTTFNENHRYLESYCLGVSENEGQYLLALWNKVPHSKSGVGMVNGAALPKTVKVSHAKVGANDIPGYPSFFWVLPSSKKLVALKLENPSFGISQLREYLNGYLTGFCSYRVVKKNEIIGYADFPAPNSGDDKRMLNKHLQPSFSISVNKITGKQSEIISRHSEVTKLVKDVHVYNNLNDNEASYIERIRSIFNNLPPAEKKKVRVQMPVNLSKDDVQQLFDLYNNNDHSSEYDVGFTFKGKSGHIEWLSGAHKKEEALIDVKWIADNHPDIDSLLKSLQKHQHLISSSCVSENSDAQTG